MKETISADVVIERIKSGNWEPFAEYGYLMMGTSEHGQFLYLQKTVEMEEPVNFSDLYMTVCKQAAEVVEEEPEVLAERHRGYANEFLLPEQPMGSATDAQALTDLYTSYGLSISGACPIRVAAINY